MIGSSAAKRRTCTYVLCPVKKVLMSRAAHLAAEVRDSSAAKLNYIYYEVSSEVTFRTAESHFLLFSASVLFRFSDLFHTKVGINKFH